MIGSNAAVNASSDNKTEDEQELLDSNVSLRSGNLTGRNRTNSDGLGRGGIIPSSLRTIAFNDTSTILPITSQMNSNLAYPTPSKSESLVRPAPTRSLPSNGSNSEIENSGNSTPSSPGGNRNRSNSSLTHPSLLSSGLPEQRLSPRFRSNDRVGSEEQESLNESSDIQEESTTGWNISKSNVPSSGKRPRSHSRAGSMVSRPSTSSLRSEGFMNVYGISPSSNGTGPIHQSHSAPATPGLSTVEQAQSILKRANEVVSNNRSRSGSQSNGSENPTLGGSSNITDLLAAFGETLALERRARSTSRLNSPNLSGSNLDGSNIQMKDF